MWRLVIATLVAGLSAVSTASAGEWTWPVRGSVITMYENDNARPYAGGMHRGIDIAAEMGTEVVAARPGTVTYAGPLGSAGNVVAVRDGRYAVSYLHLGEVSVSRGARVAGGKRVGEVGRTGRRRSVSEPHLHFGVRLAADDRYLDPLSLLPGLQGGGREPLVPVPAGPRVRLETGLVRQPVVAPVVPRSPVATPDRGRPLVWGGLVFLSLVLFGGVLMRANAACSARTAQIAARAAASLKSLGRYRAQKSSAAG
jgi:hypothetical protein